ncbi:hypothetical protein M0R88_17685 [Halorussus gelatinilyticus]|uniref:DUF7344 domain-containing protein n=1 Tax=Halorussus gelatinilyticus TaxID=2937524 RepID=A0A8U0IGY0_9EURY|nr:hypothetical protein [Halorussus gelatinilyticus]UPW00327.1 hypothetical protein M0R88_17685 [Halorussus gelatinilyticus]
MTNNASETSKLGFEVGGDRQDELFSVLSHPYRRFTLQHLRSVDTPLSVAELTTELVAWEERQSEIGRAGDGQTTVGVSLVHNHLPKMADANVVEYDATRQTVTLVNDTDEVHTHLRAMTSD